MSTNRKDKIKPKHEFQSHVAALCALCLQPSRPKQQHIIIIVMIKNSMWEGLLCVHFSFFSREIIKAEVKTSTNGHVPILQHSPRSHIVGKRTFVVPLVQYIVSLLFYIIMMIFITSIGQRISLLI